MEYNPKAYVGVRAEFSPEGGWPMPVAIHWEDGKEFEIDEVLDIRRAASLKAGGAGIRYTIRIGDRRTYLFLEEDKWFVERR